MKIQIDRLKTVVDWKEEIVVIFFVAGVILMIASVLSAWLKPEKFSWKMRACFNGALILAAVMILTASLKESTAAAGIAIAACIVLCALMRLACMHNAQLTETQKN